MACHRTCGPVGPGCSSQFSTNGPWMLEIECSQLQDNRDRVAVFCHDIQIFSIQLALRCGAPVPWTSSPGAVTAQNIKSAALVGLTQSHCQTVVVQIRTSMVKFSLFFFRNGDGWIVK